MEIKNKGATTLIISNKLTAYLKFLENRVSLSYGRDVKTMRKDYALYVEIFNSSL